MENGFKFTEDDIKQFKEFEELSNSFSAELTEEEVLAETEMLKTICYSCKHYIDVFPESGFCALKKNNCLCKNPNAMIDMWDSKCKKHELKDDFH